MKNIATETISDSVENLPVLSIGVRKGYRECAPIAAIMRAFVSACAYSRLDGGEGEIRTHGKLAPTLVFKTRAINHSATSPWSGLFIDFGGVRQEKYFHNIHYTVYTAKNARNICGFTREAY